MAVQREWCLQRGVKRFVHRAVECKHLFASHDRVDPRSKYQHMFEKERGAVAGFPDTTLWFWEPSRGACVFPCELKWGKGVLSDDQSRIGKLMASLGFHWSVAYSVVEYGEAALNAGVPLLENWRYTAAHEDELVLGDIRKQEAKAAAKNGVTIIRRQRGRAITSKRLLFGHD